MNEYKTCTKCGQLQQLSSFCKNKNRPDGLSSWCRDCSKISNKLWVQNNPDKSKASSANWRKNNPDKSKLSSTNYRLKNKDKIQEQNRLYIINNREKVNRLNAANVKKNPEAARARNAKRRFRKRNCQTFFVSKKEIKRLYGQPCYACGSKDNIQIDHIIPLARGGNHSIGNLMPLCRSCNCSKNDLFFMQWRIKKN